MNDKVKIITVVVSLSFTCFLTQCQSCQQIDKAGKKVVPEQRIYSVSCGFPSPYFDINIVRTNEPGYRYVIKDTYILPVSIIVNVLVMLALYFLIFYLAAKTFVKINRLLFIIIFLVLSFSSSLFVPFFPDVVKTVAFYTYFYPVSLIGALFEYIKIDLPDNNIPPRIYLIILIILIYLLTSLFNQIRKYIEIKLNSISRYS